MESLSIRKASILWCFEIDQEVRTSWKVCMACLRKGSHKTGYPREASRLSDCSNVFYRDYFRTHSECSGYERCTICSDAGWRIRGKEWERGRRLQICNRCAGSRDAIGGTDRLRNRTNRHDRTCWLNHSKMQDRGPSGSNLGYPRGGDILSLPPARAYR